MTEEKDARLIVITDIQRKCIASGRGLYEVQLQIIGDALAARDQQLGQALRNQNLNAAAAVIRDGELREAETALAEARQSIILLQEELKKEKEK